MKPYWYMVVMTLVLLIVQAYCDLALPQYTSDMIDVGIQNHGIQHVVPEKITAEDMAVAQLFMTDEEKSDWESCYNLNGDIYERKDFSTKELDELDEKFMIPLILTYQSVTISKEQLSHTNSAGSGQSVDAHELSSIREQMEKTADNMGSSTMKSMGIAYAISCSEKAGVDIDSIQKKYLWMQGFKMLGMALLMLAASIGAGFLASKTGAGVGRDLRKKIFTKVIKYSNTEMDHFSTASLITRSTNDVQQIQMVTAILLRMLMYAPILGIGGVIKVIHSGANMGWIIICAVLIILALVMVLMALAMPKFKAMQKLVDKLNLVSREILTGLPVIRAFGREKIEEERFDKANKNLMKTQLFTNRVMTFMMPGMMLVMYGVTLTIVWVSAHRIDSGSLQVGAMTAFITYSMQIVMSFLMLTMMSVMLPRAGVAADRIDEVLKTDTTILDPENPQDFSSVKGNLSFNNVSFRYPNAEGNALENLNFTAETGKTTAIIGSTGCGKSTLVNLIPRFYDVTEGSITIDGIDIRNVSKNDLRKKIGLVPQKGVLFSGTIGSNLKFGDPDADDDALRIAAEVAQAAEFIDSNENGFERTISQGGTNVSGGQKQRLAIARAIVKKPNIYIFDDSFSALDMKTDAALRKALNNYVKDSTVIIVAQRISTIMNADQILVLNEGKIVGKGTHAELIKNCETYRQIAKSQLSEAEIEKSIGGGQNE